MPLPNTATGDSLYRSFDGVSPANWHDVMHSASIDVKAHFNAQGDGATPDTAALQSSITATPTNGATIYLPPGRYIHSGAALSGLKSGTRIVGAGRNATIIQNTGTSDMWSIPAATSKVTFESLTLQSNNTAGHIFAPAGSIQTSNFLDCQFIQNNPAKSIWKHTDAGLIDSLWFGCILTHNGARSVPAFDFTAATVSRYNSNTWQRCQVNNEAASATWFFDFATSSASDFNYDNIFRDITCEVTNGGVARVLTGQGFVFENVNIYDLTTTVNSLFYIGAGTGTLQSRQTLFQRVGRRGGTLGVSKYDVELASGKAARTRFMFCNTATLTGYLIEGGNNTGTVLGCDNATITNGGSLVVLG